MDRQRRRKLFHFLSLTSQVTKSNYLWFLLGTPVQGVWDRRPRHRGGDIASTQLWLTDDEERLDDNVADHADAVGVDEAGVVGHDDGDVEGSDQDQPIPAGLEHAVVRQDEAGLLEGAGLVLG